MNCKQPCPGFELASSNPFPMMITTITPNAPPNFIICIIYVCLIADDVQTDKTDVIKKEKDEFHDNNEHENNKEEQNLDTKIRYKKISDVCCLLL